MQSPSRIAGTIVGYPPGGRNGLTSRKNLIPWRRRFSTRVSPFDSGMLAAIYCGMKYTGPTSPRYQADVFESAIQVASESDSKILRSLFATNNERQCWLRCWRRGCQRARCSFGLGRIGISVQGLEWETRRNSLTEKPAWRAGLSHTSPDLSQDSSFRGEPARRNRKEDSTEVIRGRPAGGRSSEGDHSAVIGRHAAWFAPHGEEAPDDSRMPSDRNDAGIRSRKRVAASKACKSLRGRTWIQRAYWATA